MNESRRYELKYVYPESAVDSVYSEVMLNPALFREVYPERTIYNIYLDSCDFGDYLDNVNGVSDRLKHRIRWYNDATTARRPTLELKFKSGHLGWKKSHPVPDFVFDKSFSWYDYRSDLERTILSDEGHLSAVDVMREMMPVLHNHYSRRYFVSADARYRITVDRELYYHHMDGIQKSGMVERDNRVVMEVKFDEHDLDGARQITNTLQSRICANSKYVTGIDSVHLETGLL